MSGSGKSDFASMLPDLLPRAIAWAEAQSRTICHLRGDPLSAPRLALARTVGVSHPELIRIWNVPEIPAPADPELRHFAREQNLIGPGTCGLTLGYGIFLLKGYADAPLLLHEFRHVHQYEAAGSIAAFLPVYLQQIADFGYDNAPYEVDARAHERTGGA